MNTIRVTTANQNSQVCTESDLNLDLVEILLGHASEQPSSATYVVELAALFALTSACEEKCLVIVLPESSSKDIPLESRSLSAEVRATPEGDSVACLALADGTVAVSERAVFATSPLEFSRLVTLWLLKDTRRLCEFLYTPETDEDLWAATQVAQSHENWTDNGGTSLDHAIALFDNFVMHSAPAERIAS
ncbi:hypothetical protein B0G80_8601 [Paraburkholderia sp. BL6669N2]|uniref:hypothetical protein n=1 Tax=Paraburkholderia sp. BL6669N2 TaxID=1938807 RepID=UPI000E3B159E|nr:hypothetical protein [Paraburkholderia sp. BL6669N2]REG52085.1 hypothetical protein B0G80_8601 [Paraburkholderia sp. BL6669N2]